MGAQEQVMRAVFDTNVVLSAVLFRQSRLSWLRDCWSNGECKPVASRETIAELLRVLNYAKFQLTIERKKEALALYLPYCEVSEIDEQCPVVCRDTDDQPLLDLAHSASALLVSGDKDLLILAGHTAFAIETPEQFAQRFR